MLERAKNIVQGNPMDTRWSVHRYQRQFEKVLNYFEIGKKEGAKILMGGEPAEMSSEVGGGYYIHPLFWIQFNASFQEEIFGLSGYHHVQR